MWWTYIQRSIIFSAWEIRKKTDEWVDRGILGTCIVSIYQRAKYFGNNQKWMIKVTKISKNKEISSI